MGIRVGLRAGEQRLVDGVAALHREHLDVLEPELLVERDGGGIVVQHRDVHVRPPAGLEVLREVTGERLANPGWLAWGVTASAHRLAPGWLSPKASA